MLNCFQKRMVVFGEEVPDVLYNIPITFASAKEPDFDDTKPTAIMSTKTHSITTEKGQEWVIFNKQQTGKQTIKKSNQMLHYMGDATKLIF